MSGKVHSRIGVIATAIFGSIYFIGVVGSFNSDLMLLLLAGSLVGSLMPDIDSTRSKASQQFTQVLFYLFAGVGCTCLFANMKSLLAGEGLIEASALKEIAASSGAFNLLMRFISQIAEPQWFFWFALIVCLGKVSPHRQFTHKWFGTSLFFITAWLSFNKSFCIGFFVGYLLHILADAITPDGWLTAVVLKPGSPLRFLKFCVANHATKGDLQNKSFFDFKLPMTDSKNRFKAHLGILPTKKVR